MSELRPSIRRMSIGINVAKASQLTKTAEQVDAFIQRIDHDHGAFDIDIIVSVNPLSAEQLAKGWTVEQAPSGNAKDEGGGDIEFIFIPGPPEGSD